MGEVDVSIEIAATPAEVWAIALDPERLKDWVTIHRSLGKHSFSAAQKFPFERWHARTGG